MCSPVPNQLGASTASKETGRCDISPLCLAAFSITTPALPARCGRLHRAAHLPRRLHRAGEPPRRRRGLAARRCRWLAGPTQQQPRRRFGRCMWPDNKETMSSLAGPRQGAGATARCQAAPPSSTAAGRNRPFPTLLYVVRKNGEKHGLPAYISSVSDVSEVRCKCFRWMLQM
jgi:hypothetical protein